jgi:hypothetical protein
MSNVQRGIFWAAAIALTAFARRSGVFDAQAADTLLLVLPIVAFLSLRGGRNCSLLRRKES